MIDFYQDYIKSIIEYFPETGEMIWKKRTSEHHKSPKVLNAWNSNFAGKVVGSIGKNGYKSAAIMNKYKVLVHHIAWIYMTGAWPEKYIDHKNGVRTDNKFDNLRPANESENSLNAKIRCDNKSGHKNVFWNCRVKKWNVKLSVNRKPIHIGYFDDLSAAALAAESARVTYHKDFARHR